MLTENDTKFQFLPLVHFSEHSHLSITQSNLLKYQQPRAKRKSTNDSVKVYQQKKNIKYSETRNSSVFLRHSASKNHNQKQFYRTISLNKNLIGKFVQVSYYINLVSPRANS